MSTLLLASSGRFITDKSPELLPEVFKNMNMAYVTTAANKVPSKDYVSARKKRMKELGFNFEEIDVTGKEKKELMTKLKDRNVVYVEGGNSFYLLKHARESGFDEVIKELVIRGVIYMGSSAGSYLATPSIVTATWKDPKKFDRCGVKDFTALGLVPFLMSVHYIPEIKKLLKSKIKTTKYPVRLLNDNQALLVRNGSITLVGDSRQIDLS